MHYLYVLDSSHSMFLAFTASPEDHSKELQRLGFVTAELARAGAAVIASPIAPRKASRDAIITRGKKNGGSHQSQLPVFPAFTFLIGGRQFYGHSVTTQWLG